MVLPAFLKICRCATTKRVGAAINVTSIAIALRCTELPVDSGLVPWYKPLNAVYRLKFSSFNEF